MMTHLTGKDRLTLYLRGIARDFVMNELEANGWSVSKTARSIGRNRTYMHRLIANLGISVKDRRLLNKGRPRPEIIDLRPLTLKSTRSTEDASYQ